MDQPTPHRRTALLPATWTRWASAGALALLALGGGSAGAHDPMPAVTVAVTPVPEAVSQSRAAPAALASYAAYAVHLTRVGEDPVKQVRLSASLATVGGTSAGSFVESIPAGVCAASATVAGAIDCTVGPLLTTADFTVVVKAPSDGSQLAFNYGGSYSRVDDGRTKTAALVPGQALTGLIASTDAQRRSTLRSFLPSAGGTFFTGDNAVALRDDVSTTRLAAPAGLGLTRPIGVDETVELGGLTNDTTHRFTTQIAVPAPVGSLLPAVVTFELHRDASTIRDFDEVKRAPLLYTADPGEPWQVVNQALPGCGDYAYYPMARGPSATYPVCVDQRIAVKKKMVGQAAPGGGVYGYDDVGDWIFVIRALQNGKTSW